MKIQITNGNADPNNGAFEAYLNHLESRLAGAGHQVTRSTLREMDLRGCNGCFGCWIKAPGECLLPDDGPILCRAIIQSDFHLLAAPLRMGFPGALLKTAMDKTIPLIHPYFEMVYDEVHHRARYERYPQMGLLLQPEPDTDARDLHILGDIFSRVALNMKSELRFVATTRQPAEDVAAALLSPQTGAGIAFDRDLGPIPGQRIDPPSRLTVFNGSPRGKKGNTPLLLSQFIRGFESNPGKTAQVYHLNRLNDRAIFQAAFGEAECVLLGSPLYVDSLPGQVIRFIESLEEFTQRASNPALGFLVQSGFPETLHARHVEPFLEKLAGRLSAPYWGAMLRGGMEGTRYMPESMSAGIFETLYQLGRIFGQTGQLDAALLKTFADLERFPEEQVAGVAAYFSSPQSGAGWDRQLEQNGALERNFARPYSSPEY